jgi:hypothetical protein
MIAGRGFSPGEVVDVASIRDAAMRYARGVASA